MSVISKTLNFANFLSISRIFAIFPLIYFLDNIGFGNYSFYSKITVLYIVLSDVLDGYFARNYNQVTDFGKIIDPVADKISLWVVLIFLIDKYNLPFLIFFILLSLRDFFLTSFTVYLLIKYNYVSQANFYGKLFIFTSVVMSIMYIYDFSDTMRNISYYFSILILLISTFQYIKEHRTKIEEYETI